MKTILLIIIMLATMAQAYTDSQIANAIYMAEGGASACYKYGIKSVKYRDEADARRICLNTIRNNRARFTRQSEYTDFIEFLGSRYCPPSVHKLNRYWVKNVRHFLEKNNEN